MVTGFKNNSTDMWHCQTDKSNRPDKSCDTTGQNSGSNNNLVTGFSDIHAHRLCVRFAQHQCIQGFYQKKTNDNSGKRSEEHTSELQSRENLVCRLLLE